MFVQVAEFPEELKQLQHGIHFDIKAPDYVWFNHCIINEDSNLDHPGMIQQDVYHSFDVNSIPIKAIAKGMVGIALIETKDIPYLRSLGEIIIIKKHLEWFSKSQHECVLYALTQKIGSDVKFGSVQPLGDLTDRLSPDDIVVDAEDKRAAMELKTIARPISGSTRAFEAHAKYKKAVELRRGLKKWDLIIFVQTLGATYHNFGRRIDDQVLQYYYKWFLIGIALGRKLRAASGPVENKLEFDQFRASLKHVLLNSSSSHDYTTMDLHRNNPNNDLQISEEEWIHWSKKPVNFESVFDKLLHKAQKDYLKPTVSEPELLTTFESAWKKFVNNWESFGSNTTLPGTRPKEEQKPICIWPMIYPLVEPDTSEFSHEFSNIELGAFVAGKGGLYEAWSLASDYAFNHPENFIEPKDLATMTPKEHRIHRNKYMRVDLRYLSESSLEELALQGLWAKKRRNQDLMKLRKQLNKRPVHPDCITKDVDDFIRNNLKMTELSSDITLEPFRKSYNAAKEHLTTMPDITTKIEDFISYFSMTSIGQNSALIGLISEELNLSLNQFCKKGHCVLKKIPFYDLYLLIRPTTATGKMFFSIAAKKENFSISELPFREASTITENYIIYDFVSVDRQKIVQTLSLFEKTCQLLNFWITNLGYTVIEDDWKISLDVIQHFNFSYLLTLEDKPQTSFSLQNVRYMYTKICFSEGNFKDISGIWSKMHEFPRSRLLVWSYKKLFDAFKIMILNSPRLNKPHHDQDEYEDVLLDGSMESEDSVASHDNFEGLYSWVTGRKIKKFSQALSLSYLGILHNRDEIDPMMSQFEIFQKTIKEELELRKTAGSTARKGNAIGKEKLEDHEFDEDFIIASAELLKKKLLKSQSIIDEQGFFDMIEDLVFKQLFDQDTESFATFKASCVPPVNLAYDMEKEKSINAKRKRCLERILDLCENDNMGFNPFLSLDTLLNKIEKQGGVFIDLFQKPQWGGVREILVMQMEGRLAVSFVEHCCRAISELFPSEMLTRGTVKHKALFSHVGGVRDIRDPEDITVSSTDSDDASTWCQRFTMPIFACFLSRLLPPYFGPTIVRILNSMTFKNLVLPNNLLYQFFTHPDVRSYSEEIQELHDQFLGKSDVGDLCKPGHKILHNRSNMGQGIFHYTSSVLHSAVLELYEHLTQMCFERLSAHTMGNLKHLVVTCQASSDDSGVLRTVVCKAESWAIAVRFLKFCTDLKQALYPFFGAKHSSEKSTSACYKGFYEFNSRFFLGPDEISVLLKFFWASIGAKTVTRLEGRVISSIELRKQMLENGATFLDTAVTQFLQMRVHYAMLGSKVKRSFKITDNLLSVARHPLLGFYPLEEPHLNSLFGYQYTIYRLTQKDKYTSAVEKALYNTGDLSFDELGRPSLSIRTLMGSNRRYFGFLDRVQQVVELEDGEWRDYFSANPDLFFRKAKNRLETVMKIMKKVHSPGAEEAMVFSSASHMYALSVYLIDTDSTIIREYGVETRKFLAEKKSLNDMLINALEKVIQMTNGDSEEFTLSPYIHDQAYNLGKILEVEESFKGVIPVRMMRNRPMKPFSLVINDRFDTSRSLLNVVKSLWFNLDDKAFSSETKTSFEFFSKQFKWLKSNWEDSLSHPDNPFYMDPHSFADYLMSWSRKVRETQILTPAPKFSDFISSVKSIVTHSFSKPHILPSEKGLETSNLDHIEMKNLQHRVSNILLSGLNLADKAKMITEQILDLRFDISQISSDRNFLSRSDLAFLSMVRCVHSLEFLQFFSRDSKAFKTYWVQPQNRRGPFKWEGPGTLMIELSEPSNEKIAVHVQDSTVSAIEKEKDVKISKSMLKALKSVLFKHFSPYPYTAASMNLKGLFLKMSKMSCDVTQAFSSGCVPISEVESLDFQKTDDYAVSVETDHLVLVNIAEKIILDPVNHVTWGVEDSFERFSPVCFWRTEVSLEPRSLYSELNPLPENFTTEESLNILRECWNSNLILDRELWKPILSSVMSKSLCETNDEMEFFRRSCSLSVLQSTLGYVPSIETSDLVPKPGIVVLKPEPMEFTAPKLKDLEEMLSFDLEQWSRDIEEQDFLIESNFVRGDSIHARINLMRFHPMWKDLLSFLNSKMSSFTPSEAFLTNAKGKLKPYPYFDDHRTKWLREIVTNWAPIDTFDDDEMREWE